MKSIAMVGPWGILDLPTLALGSCTYTPTIFCMMPRLSTLEACILAIQELSLVGPLHLGKLGVCSFGTIPLSLVDRGKGVLVDLWPPCFYPPWNVLWPPLLW